MDDPIEVLRRRQRTLGKCCSCEPEQEWCPACIEDDAIETVLARLERLERGDKEWAEAMDCKGKYLCVGDEKCWTHELAAAEARVKELEAELRRHVADSVVVVQENELLRAALDELREFMPRVLDSLESDSTLGERRDTFSAIQDLFDPGRPLAQPEAAPACACGAKLPPNQVLCVPCSIRGRQPETAPKGEE